jgi:hypothetical protein
MDSHFVVPPFIREVSMAEDQHQRPTKDFNVITQSALKAYGLYIKYQSDLKERLGKDISMEADLALLGVQVPGAKESKSVSKTATAEQEAALLRGYELVTAVRAAISRQKPAPEIRKAYGVGVRTNVKVVKDVKVAISLIINRATENAEEARSVKLLPRDIEELKKRLLEIGDADQTQEEQRARAPQGTKARNATARRLITATDEIIAAGLLEFATRPTERKEFQDLIGAGNPNPTAEQKAKRAATAKEKRNKT